MRLALILLAACASAPPARVDWAAVDAAIREARWRTDHCTDPNSAKCDALFLVREELEAIIEAAHEAFEKKHRAEIERLTTP